MALGRVYRWHAGSWAIKVRGVALGRLVCRQLGYQGGCGGAVKDSITRSRIVCYGILWVYLVLQKKI